MNATRADASNEAPLSERVLQMDNTVMGYVTERAKARPPSAPGRSYFTCLLLLQNPDENGNEAAGVSRCDTLSPSHMVAMSWRHDSFEKNFPMERLGVRSRMPSLVHSCEGDTKAIMCPLGLVAHNVPVS